MSTASKRGAQPRARRRSAYEIEKDLKQSLESTDNGLKRFLLSLKESGMAEGAQGYRALSMVLVQQRLWAKGNRRTQLEPMFRSIAKTAGELHRVFAVYAEVMKTLKELDKLSEMSVPEAQTESNTVQAKEARAEDADEGCADPEPNDSTPSAPDPAAAPAETDV